jgi:hypothetical protein
MNYFAYKLAPINLLYFLSQHCKILFYCGAPVAEIIIFPTEARSLYIEIYWVKSSCRLPECILSYISINVRMRKKHEVWV